MNPAQWRADLAALVKPTAEAAAKRPPAGYDAKQWATFCDQLLDLHEQVRLSDPKVFAREMDDLRLQACHPEVWEAVQLAREPLRLDGSYTPRERDPENEALVASVAMRDQEHRQALVASATAPTDPAHGARCCCSPGRSDTRPPPRPLGRSGRDTVTTTTRSR